MSVIVKGMEMPKNCKDCQLLAWNGGYYCTANRTNIEVLRIKSRCDDCPLIELPPHGRLIDADKLKSRLVLDNDSSELQRISADILKWIDIQETVIEGSET